MACFSEAITSHFLAMANRTPHSKLGQTLQDLESALADWDALGEAGTPTPAADNVASEPRVDTELRKKTKKLLDQLREQLKDLET